GPDDERAWEDRFSPEAIERAHAYGRRYIDYIHGKADKPEPWVPGQGDVDQQSMQKFLDQLTETETPLSPGRIEEMGRGDFPPPVEGGSDMTPESMIIGSTP